jgi:pantothenate synthetase
MRKKSHQNLLILKRDHPATIPAKFALIWFYGFRGEDLNVIFYQDMSNLHTQHFSSSLIRFSSSESDSEVLLVFVSGLTDGQSCQAIDSFLRGVYINVGEILNSDWLKSYIYFPYTPTQLISKNVKKQEILKSNKR